MSLSSSCTLEFRETEHIRAHSPVIRRGDLLTSSAREYIESMGPSFTVGSGPAPDASVSVRQNHHRLC